MKHLLPLIVLLSHALFETPPPFPCFPSLTLSRQVSLQLERQSMTDVEAELLSRWYKEQAADLIEISK